jgi:hypothetical protein
MRAQGRPGGTKQKVRVAKEKERRLGVAVFLGVVLMMVVVLAYFACILSLPQCEIDVPESYSTKAAIVDQLSLTLPNRTFVEESTSIMKSAGYSVDYYAGEQVTVGFYRNLPTLDYGLILLRVHSVADALVGNEFKETQVCFLSSEMYSQSKYVWEQLADQVVQASYVVSQPPFYFAVSPKFVSSSMNGAFQRTVVVMMGCKGLSDVGMGEAFVKKGAKAYVGWEGSVLASHTDIATVHLLQRLLVENQTLGDAVLGTMEDVGRDPAYKSQLGYYPLDAGHQTVMRGI